LKWFVVLAIISLVLLSGCNQGTDKVTPEQILKYQCINGQFVDSQEGCESLICPELNCSECPSTTCPTLDCSICPKETETITKYVCTDGETIVDAIENCPTEEETMNSSEYAFQEVNKSQTLSETHYNTGPLKVTLVKVGKKIFGDKMKLRVYWKVENLSTKSITVHPHQRTIILANNSQYESDLMTKEDEVDDFSIGGSSGGDLRAGIIAEGGVSVDNIPATAKNLKIILDNIYIGEYTFNVTLS